MLIIIAGDGKTGAHLAQVLSGENQDIVLMGLNREHLEALEAEHNFITCPGNPTYEADLRRCGIERADLFVAVTPDENMNIVGCEMAKRLGARLCAARIDSPQLSTARAEATLRELGIDMVFIPEKAAADSVRQFVRHNWFSDCMRLNQGKLLIIGVKIEEMSPMCGNTLRDISAHARRPFHVSAIRRGDSIIIPTGNDVPAPGDVLYISTLAGDMDYVREICGKRKAPTKNIFIAGGGRITEELLGLIKGQYNITVFEPSHTRCEELAAKFPETVTVNASSEEVQTLKEEGIENCDMFIALTGKSEANMVSCMVARTHGVSRTVARIEELQYIPEAESLHIDKIVNKKRLNAGSVLDMLLDSGLGNGQCLSIAGAEIASVTVGGSSPVTRAAVSRLSLPRGVTLAGMIRDGEALLVDGSTELRAGDVVVVLFISGMLAKVRKLFK